MSLYTLMYPLFTPRYRGNLDLGLGPRFICSLEGRYETDLGKYLVCAPSSLVARTTRLLRRGEVLTYDKYGGGVRNKGIVRLRSNGLAQSINLTFSANVYPNCSYLYFSHQPMNA